MAQIMMQLCAPAGEAERFKAWCLDDLASHLASDVPHVEHLIVNLAQLNPVASLYASESLQGEEFDVVVQLWVDPAQGWRDALAAMAAKLAGRTRVQHAYRITDTLIKHDAPLLAGRPSPGFKLMRGLHFCADLPAATARRQWLHHAELAVKVHVGMARYTQHWVDEVLTSGSPAIGGLSDLHYPCIEAMRDRYFDSPRGKEEIVHDIGHFIASGTQRFCGQEHIVK